ncbi:glycoside hydrolase family 97 protein [Hymenobacter properus]|uniref:Glycoside hydrolase family 97 protein n=1 Tax=Hymenobacter properus TaxID=2791026 RepID=A0A931BH57_9BACT|nr:glycoside hydrolase family 97 protein [Hymenobacter properus]MBF9141536.1 glycoside hydrolase family 97 protein [Hymenobacter properus]MBR7720345.1 glycoside hydrolase family 97 protein [Microvirga sp. SRT04]
MKRILLAVGLLGAGHCAHAQAASPLTARLDKVSLRVALGPDRRPTYSVFYGPNEVSLRQEGMVKGPKEVIKPSRLGLSFADGNGFDGPLVMVGSETKDVDETWQPVWGEVKSIRNHYQQLTVHLRQPAADGRKMDVVFRVFADGVGFRYEFPRQTRLQYFTVQDEHTEFNLPANHKAFWIPGDYDSNEYTYTTSRLSEVNTTPIEPIQQKADPKRVQTPLMLKSDDGLYVNIHEAALVNYPAMFLNVNTQTFGLSSQLVPDATGTGAKAYLQAPEHTPWRTIVVADNAPAVLASKLILNLNEPSKVAETSWIKPQKFVGVWWEMHVNRASWNYADTSNIKLAGTNWNALKNNGHHGANTANVKRYIDFAAAHHIPGVLVEGWNVGWEDWANNWKEEVFDFVTPYPDFDVDELQRYAAGKGVKLIMHHETSSSVTNYERRQDAAYRFMQQHGYDAVKTGYVGRIIPRGEHHDGQWMVNHYVRTAQRTADSRIMVDMHESVRPTGLHRTYPNWLANEAARGNEFNAWSSGNPPEHETILPFTRLMGGPMDYTPGIFQIKLDDWNPARNQCKQVHTTLAKQLALYVTMYSPLQMAADLPEAYNQHLDAFQFIEDVPVDWDDTRILAAEPGDYLTTVRKAKGKDEWYLGAITDENARQQAVKLDFLTPGQRYEAIIYADGKGADWQKNPMAYRITKQTVTSKSVLKLQLAPGGGAAVSFKPVK